MNMVKILTIFLILAATGLPAQADIYKYKDSDGKWRYTDVPPRSDVIYDVISRKKADTNKNAKIMTKAEVLQATSAPKSNKSAVGEQKNGEAAKDKETAKADAEKIKAAQLAVAQESAAIKEENCRMAKMSLATYQQGGRIKRVNEKGEPVMLSDADIANGRVSAQKEVDQYCSS